MATTGASGSDLAIRALLGLLIVGLVVVLFFVTVVPAQRAAAAERETELTRERMSDLRTALIAYRDSLEGYPSTLDSLVLFVRTDSAFNAQIEAEEERLRPINVDSLVYSPRTGARFNYEVVQDTSGVEIYWLGDPDMEADSIGSRDPNPALRNAASWE
jgi:type II secretory pathway pseudopilin PulG